MATQAQEPKSAEVSITVGDLTKAIGTTIAIAVIGLSTVGWGMEIGRTVSKVNGLLAPKTETANAKTAFDPFVKPGQTSESMVASAKGLKLPARNEKKPKANDGQLFDPLPTNHRLRVREVINATKNSVPKGSQNGFSHKGNGTHAYSRRMMPANRG